jgi:hypothetical protein
MIIQQLESVPLRGWSIEERKVWNHGKNHPAFQSPASRSFTPSGKTTGEHTTIWSDLILPLLQFKVVDTTLRRMGCTDVFRSASRSSPPRRHHYHIQSPGRTKPCYAYHDITACENITCSDGSSDPLSPYSGHGRAWHATARVSARMCFNLSCRLAQSGQSVISYPLRFRGVLARVSRVLPHLLRMERAPRRPDVPRLAALRQGVVLYLRTLYLAYVQLPAIHVKLHAE